MKENYQKKPKVLGKNLISLLIIGWFSVMGIGVLSLNSLSNPGELNSEKNSIKETIVPEAPPELVISEFAEEKEKSKLSFLTLIILLLICSGGSLLVTHVLKLLVTSNPEKEVIKKKKNPSVMVTKPQIAQSSSSNILLIPPQTSIPLDRENPSLAQIMDLRKKRSLVSIMHDN